MAYYFLSSSATRNTSNSQKKRPNQGSQRWHGGWKGGGAIIKVRTTHKDKEKEAWAVPSLLPVSPIAFAPPSFPTPCSLWNREPQWIIVTYEMNGQKLKSVAMNNYWVGCLWRCCCRFKEFFLDLTVIWFILYLTLSHNSLHSWESNVMIRIHMYYLTWWWERAYTYYTCTTYNLLVQILRFFVPHHLQTEQLANPRW